MLTTSINILDSTTRNRRGKTESASGSCAVREEGAHVARPQLTNAAARPGPSQRNGDCTTEYTLQSTWQAHQWEACSAVDMMRITLVETYDKKQHLQHSLEFVRMTFGLSVADYFTPLRWESNRPHFTTKG